MNKFLDILIAEDDTDDYLFFKESLESIYPANITRVKNGLDCITYLKTQTKPDLIFLDLNMPIKNGIECLKYIKDTDCIANIPVTIFSTSHYIKDIDCAYKNGAHYYIVKPADAAQLSDVLQSLFRKLNNSAEIPPKGKFVVRVTAEMDSQSIAE